MGPPICPLLSGLPRLPRPHEIRLECGGCEEMVPGALAAVGCGGEALNVRAFLAQCAPDIAMSLKTFRRYPQRYRIVTPSFRVPSNVPLFARVPPFCGYTPNGLVVRDVDLEPHLWV